MFGSTWPHKLLIGGGSSGGSQDLDTSGWNPGNSGDAIYDDRCDAQEVNTTGGLQITTNDTQIETKTADLKIFLKDESKINDLEVGMQGVLTRGDRIDTIKITKIRIVDGQIEANTV